MLTRIAVLSPLRQREFAILWAGLSLSLVGDGIFSVALVWQVYTLTNGASAMALAGLALTLPPTLLVLAGGAITDRTDRRLLLIVSYLFQGVIMAALGALAASGSLSLAPLLALVAVYASAHAVAVPAFTAFIPQVVPETALTEANALDGLVRQLAWYTIGPLVGGVVVASVGTSSAFLIDAASFLAPSLSLLFTVSRPLPSRTSRRSLQADVGAGLAFVRSRRWLVGGITAGGFVLICMWGPYRVLMPLVVKQSLHGSARDLGFILGLGGVGAMLASLPVARRRERAQAPAFVLLTWTLATLLTGCFGLVRAIPLAIAVSPFRAGLFAAGNIGWTARIQTDVPGGIVGRVASIDWLVQNGAAALSFALAPAAAALVGASTAIVGTAVIGAAATAAVLLWVQSDPSARQPSGATADVS